MNELLEKVASDLKPKILTAIDVADYEGAKQAASRIADEILEDVLRRRLGPLLEAGQAAYEHMSELEGAWQRGAISEHDCFGGTRSNRNTDILRSMDAALKKALEE